MCRSSAIYLSKKQETIHWLLQEIMVSLHKELEVVELTPSSYKVLRVLKESQFLHIQEDIWISEVKLIASQGNKTNKKKNHFKIDSNLNRLTDRYHYLHTL